MDAYQHKGLSLADQYGSQFVEDEIKSEHREPPALDGPLSAEPRSIVNHRLE